MRSFAFDVIQNKLPQLIDNGNCVFVALSLGFPPSKEAMTAQDDTVTIWAFVNCPAKHHREFESRALPGHPDQAMFEPPIELHHLFQTIGRRGQRDAPVRVQMIDVPEG